MKFLKDFYTALGSFDEGETYDLDFDDYTLNNWIEVGACIEVKKARLVKKDEVKPSADK